VTPRHRITHVLPVPVPPAALAAFAAQLSTDIIDPDVTVEFTAPDAGPLNMLDSAYERTLADIAVTAAGIDAARRGADAVVINSMSDSGLAALRSRLPIPVVGACQASLAIAGTLGHRIGIITMWPQWHALYPPAGAPLGPVSRVAAILDIGVRPDAEALLAGREEEVFPQLDAACRTAIDGHGADVIVLGSTTMHQAWQHLAGTLSVPVINPGAIAHQVAQLLLRARLTHSRIAYPAADRPADVLLAAFAPGLALAQE
jgi:allantoin racemase